MSWNPFNRSRTDLTNSPLSLEDKEKLSQLIQKWIEVNTTLTEFLSDKNDVAALNLATFGSAFSDFENACRRVQDDMTKLTTSLRLAQENDTSLICIHDDKEKKKMMEKVVSSRTNLSIKFFEMNEVDEMQSLDIFVPTIQQQYNHPLVVMIGEENGLEDCSGLYEQIRQDCGNQTISTGKILLSSSRYARPVSPDGDLRIYCEAHVIEEGGNLGTTEQRKIWNWIKSKSRNKNAIERRMVVHGEKSTTNSVVSPPRLPDPERETCHIQYQEVEEEIILKVHPQIMSAFDKIDAPVTIEIPTNDSCVRSRARIPDVVIHQKQQRVEWGELEMKAEKGIGVFLLHDSMDSVTFDLRERKSMIQEVQMNQMGQLNPYHLQNLVEFWRKKRIKLL